MAHLKKLLPLYLLFIIACGSGKEPKPVVPKTEEKQPQSGKSVLMVIAPKDFRDEEFKEPYDLLTKSGMRLTIASTDTTSARGMLGMVVKPQILLNQVNPDSFEAIVIAGGVGCKVLWDDTTLHRIVCRFNEVHKPIAAICIAPVVLARAGILKDKKATVYPEVAGEIRTHCLQYSASDVEVSDNVITASGPHAAKEFAKAILELLTK